MLNLKDEIETRVSRSKPKDLMEAQEAVFEAETIISEKRSLRTAQVRLMPSVPKPIERKPESKAISFIQQEKRPLGERVTMKYIKCNQIGHLANQRQNFRIPSQQNQPPRTRVKHM